MEEQVFEKHDVASFMNEHFISIKVDREERPDLDATYMQSVLRMTGRGGWPLSVFLTPDLKPFFGGTYFPPDVFIELARRILDVFRNHREELNDQAERWTEAIEQGFDKLVSHPFDARLLDDGAKEAEGSFDPHWGGFRASMKFPTPVRWRFILRRYRKTGAQPLAQMVRKTLDAIAAGGIRDHLAGGFHRYSVDERWQVPHFEKMLYDNAQLASLYLEAGAVFDHPPFFEITRETLDFLMREMQGKEGAFYASFDADSDGTEGAYYVWSLDELLSIAGPRDGSLLASLFGVTENGTFEGANVLWRNTPIARVARDHGVDEKDVLDCFSRWRKALLSHRNQRKAPRLDRKLVTAWNGLAIQAFARAASVLDDPTYLMAAERAANHLWNHHRQSDGTIVRASTDGIVGHSGILDDYAAMAVAFLDLHQASNDIEYVLRAQSIVQFVLDRFSRSEGGFFLTSSDQTAPLGRRFEPFDSVEPSGNSMMLEAMVRLAMLTGEQRLVERTRASLEAMTSVMERAGLEMAGWLDVAQLYLGPCYEIVLAGEKGDEQLRSLERKVRKTAASHLSLMVVGADGAEQSTAQLIPFTAGKTARDGVSTGYVCTFGSCHAPTTSHSELHTQMMVGWQR